MEEVSPINEKKLRNKVGFMERTGGWKNPTLSNEVKVYLGVLTKNFNLTRKGDEWVAGDKKATAILREYAYNPDSGKREDFGTALLNLAHANNKSSSPFNFCELPPSLEALLSITPPGLAWSAITGDFIERMAKKGGNCLEFVTAANLMAAMFYDGQVEARPVAYKDEDGHPHFVLAWKGKDGELNITRISGHTAYDYDRETYGEHGGTFDQNIDKISPWIPVPA